jgi:hypothetical protein
MRTARVRGADAGPGREGGAQRREVARCVDVERQRGGLRDGHARAAGPRAGGVTGERAHPEGGRERVRRVDQQGVRPAAVAIRHDHHGGRAGIALQQRGHLAGVERRAVAGDEQHPRGAAGGRRLDAELRSRRLAGLDRVGHDLHARLARGRGGALLRRDHDDVVEAGNGGQRGEHVTHHRGRQHGAVRRVDGRAEALLRAGERLHGQDGGGPNGPHSAPMLPGGASAERPREGERLRGQAPARIRIGHGHVRLQRRQPVRPLVGHQAVEQPVVVSGDPVRRERAAGPGEEGVRRALEHLAADERGDRDDGAAVVASASRTPGTARIGPIEMIGLEGPTTTASAPAMASSSSRGAAASAAPGTRRPPPGRPPARGS